MSVKQLSVFIENRRGMLVEVTEALTKENIDIRALALAETPDYGILRLIVSDPERAFDAIKRTGRTVSVNQVLGVKIPDDPGGLMKALCVLNDNGIDVEYMYAFIAQAGRQANVIFRVADNERSGDILKEAGYQLLTDSDAGIKP